MTFVVPICVAPLALLGTVGSRDIVHLIVVVTVRVDLTLLIAGLRIDAVKAGGAISVGAFGLTVRVMATFGLGIHLITNNIGAVNFAWPVAHRTIRVLEAHVKRQGPSSLTHAVLANHVLTICTRNQAGFSRRTTLPESAAVYQGMKRIENINIQPLKLFLLVECSW